MWPRNLLFVLLLLAGGGALGAVLFPRPTVPCAPGFDPSEFQAAEFRTRVKEINDAFRRDWSEAALEPADPADERTIIRRLSLALTGSIPSLQEIRQWENYDGPDRLHWWIAGLLKDRRSADYLAERLARAYVGTEDGPFIIYRRRRFVSWLSDELLHHQPYDEIVRQLIAAQGLWTDQPATNFITVTFQPDKKSPDPERLAGRVARAFLGIRLDCAQCHNHPFEKWKQADFQGLAAFFGQTHQGFTGIYDGAGEYTVEDRKTGVPRTIAPRVPPLFDLPPAEGTRRQLLAAWVTHPNNGYFARATVNRFWALLFGRPLVEPVDDLGSVGDNPPRVLQVLADDFVAHGYDLRRLIHLIAATEAFHLDSAADHEITSAHEKVWAAFPLTRLRPEQVAGSVLQAGSLETLSAESHLLVRIATAAGQNDFVKRYGDTGEDEFTNRGGTIPQRLLLMNGNLVKEKTKEALFNAATQIGWIAPDDSAAIETAYLAVLTRRPTQEELQHFTARLGNSKGNERGRRMEDLYWSLLNATEFSWNH